MSNRATTYRHFRGALWGALLAMVSCVNSLEITTPYGHNQAGEDVILIAKTYFNNHIDKATRTESDYNSRRGLFIPGNITPDWDSAITISNNDKRHTDFNLHKDNRFFLLFGEEYENRVDLYSRFVSVEEFAIDTINQYIATYIPDLDYLPYYTIIARDAGINCTELYNFSGVVLYTTPTGYYIGAYRYSDGNLIQRAFLYDRNKSQYDNILDFCNVMNNFTVGIAFGQKETRSFDENNPTGIEEIVIVDGVKPSTISLMEDEYKKDNSETPILVEPITHRLEGGGGGGSMPEDEEEPTPQELADKLFDTKKMSEEEKASLTNMIAQIIEDCLGKELCKQLIEKDCYLQITFDLSRKLPSEYNHQLRSIILTKHNGGTLLHEMFHAFQHTETKQYTPASANYEVESLLAQYTYLSRNRAYTTIQQYNKYCQTHLGGIIKKAGDVLDHNGHPYVNDSIFIDDFYSPSINKVLDIATQQNVKNIYYDNSKTVNENLHNLQLLSKKCP